MHAIHGIRVQDLGAVLEPVFDISVCVNSGT